MQTIFVHDMNKIAQFACTCFKMNIIFSLMLMYSMYAPLLQRAHISQYKQKITDGILIL